MVNPPASAKRRRAAIIAGALALSLGSNFGAGGALAADTFAADYSIAFAGITVAKSSFRTTLDGKSLQLNADIRSTGLVDVFANTKGSSAISATLTDKGFVPGSYRLSMKTGSKTRTTAIDFSNGTATSTVITPTPRARPEHIQLQPEHLVGVTDPFLATVVSASSPDAVCNRTVRFYDGLIRADLVLRPAGAESVSIEGFEGEAVRCAVKVKPIAGYSPDSKDMEFIARGERGSILFAPLASGTLYAPVKLSLKTRSGTVSVTATRFRQSAG